jgi:hypothetical protein
MSPTEQRMDEQQIRNSNPAHMLYTVRLHYAISRSNSISDETRDWTVVRCLAYEIDFDVVDIAPAPSLRRVVALNNRMTGRFKVPPGMTIGRLVAAADMAATAAKS